MIHIDKDDTTYIGFSAVDGEENLYPRVKIHNISDTLISTVDLSHVADGKYRGTWTPDTVGYYGVSVITYTDAGHTTESSKYGRDGATYKVDEVETKVSNIETDTNELQTDWTNNGRLDTILDAAAVEANVETHVTNSLNSYDPPTRTELTNDKNSIISEIDANETKIDTMQGNITDILSDTGTTLDDKLDTITGKLPTHYIMGAADQSDWSDEISNLYINWNPGGDLYVSLDAINSWLETLKNDWLNGGRLDSLIDELTSQGDTNETKLDTVTTNVGNLNDISTSDVNAQCTKALGTYDPPTKTEMDTMETSLTAEIDANESKIDTIDTVVDAVKAKTDTIDWTDVTFIKDCEGGGWKRDGTKLYLYKSDNTTLIAEFNLKNEDGDAAGETSHVFQKDRV